MSYLHRLAFLAAACLAALAAVAPAAPARAAGISRETCAATGSAALYTSPAMTTLVDYFTVNSAPTQHYYSPDYSIDNSVIQADGAAPGVDVTGLLTGTVYRFEFRSIYITHTPASGGAGRTAWADWRVTQSGGGIVSDARNQQILVYTQDGAVVTKFFNNDHGLTLSAGLEIRCPSF